MVPRTPSAGENGGPSDAVGSTGPAAPAPRDYVCAVVGFALTVAGVAALYPASLAASQPYGYLVVTALVGAFVVAWLAVWTCLEAVWEWRTGGGDGS